MSAKVKAVPAPQHREALERIPSEYLTCRALQHAWRYTTVKREDKWTWSQSYQCSRCDTERVQHIDARDGGVMKTHYYYPAGYLLNDDGGPLSQTERGYTRLRSMGVVK